MTVSISYSQEDTLSKILRGCYTDALRLDSCVNYSNYQDSIVNDFKQANKTLKLTKRALIQNSLNLKKVNDLKDEVIDNKNKEIKGLRRKGTKATILGISGWAIALLLLL